MWSGDQIMVVRGDPPVRGSDVAEYAEICEGAARCAVYLRLVSGWQVAPRVKDV
jgi:hypothetical protein